MSIFSDKLEKYVEQKKMPVYTLAKICGMDRSLMYKIVHGTRRPSSVQVVEKIAKSLELTPHDRSLLLEAWHITDVGEHIYYERKIILSLIENLHPEKKVLGEKRMESRKEDYVSGQELVICGKNNVNTCLKMLIEEEAERPSPVFRMICQPETSFLFEMLAVYCADRADCEVRHLICLEESVEKEENRYNLQCLNRMTPLLRSSCKYKVHYYYDRVQSHFYNMNVLPYLFLTENGMVQMSPDFEYGICTRMPEKIKFFREIFENYLGQTEKLFMEEKGVNGISEQYGERVAQFNKVTAVLTPAPVQGAVSMEMIVKHLKPTFAEKQELMVFLTSNKEYCQQCVESKDYLTFFTEEGIRDFMDDGNIVDLIADQMEKLSREERLEALKRMQRMMEAGEVHAQLIRPGLLNMPRDFYMTFYENGQSDIIFRTSGKQWRVLQIHEKSLGISFGRFIRFLPECPQVCTAEESCQFIREMVEEYTCRL